MDYLLSGVPLRLVCSPASRELGIARALESLFSLARSRNPVSGISLIIVNDGSPEPEVSGEIVFDAPGLSAIKTRSGYHLRAETSYLSVDLSAGCALGSLSDSFLDSPLEQQRGLFLFAFLLLLSRQQLYPLHAGGVCYGGCGFLLVGSSGSGKTTLTGALTRSGWHYLSDDSVLLHSGPHGIEALAFGRPFHCAPEMLHHFPEFAEDAHPAVSGKRLVNVDSIYPSQFLSRMRPRIILFPEIVPETHSRLIPLDCTATLVRLLGQGTGLLHSREFVDAQVAVLNGLTRSTRAFRLLHGADVHHDPTRLAALLQLLANPQEDLKGDDTHARYSAA